MIRIELPAALQTLAGGHANLEVAGTTVGEALENLGRSHPLLLSRILTRGGRLRPHVNLFVNERDVRTLEGLDTPLTAGDTLLVVPSVAGG
ncbi:ubiquitin-like small modifier protein 1 [Wenzhouxiangella limi]|uniref:ubiquitin-like small modifier protein 1 n=1 Tax=Wenzhouxiangella limi TaxID=2707351 RepID=UPI0019440E73|nr:ubiquitin-like small modifier protein 1 [Wenzhouxiangella limi]